MADAYLVTGSTGLIGSALVRALARDGVRTIAAARNVEKANAMFGAMPSVRVLEWDVTKPVRFDGDIGTIVHAAAETSSRAFVEKPVETICSVLDGTRNALALAREKNVRAFVYLSTMEVYGAPDADPVSESDYGYLDPTAVRSSYPEAKRLAENLCVAHLAEYGTPVRIARLAQTFGEGAKRGDGRVFAQFAEAIADGRDIVLHTEGRTARCYCHVDDAVDAIRLLAERGRDGEAYNIANPETFCTIREMAEKLCAAHPPSRVVFDTSLAKGRGYAPEFRMRLSAGKAEALGWRARVGLMEMFERLVSEFRRDAAV